jgi:alpha-L-fucosidase 2
MNSSSGDRLELTGTRFAALMRIIDEGGTGTIEAHGDKLVVSGTRAVTILLSARTDYRSEDPEAECRRDIESAASRSFDELRMRHIAEHQSWFAARVLNCTMRLKTKPSHCCRR